jgi:hypothetical protein
VTGPLPVAPSTTRLRPLGLTEVRITGGFWGQRQDVNANATLTHCLDSMVRTGWIENFHVTAAGLNREQRPGREFSDSEIYKLTEAMAWEVGRSQSAFTAAELTKLADTIASAQAADGYLNTAFGQTGLPPRYSDLEWGHELYCHGHLIQAGVADARTGADSGLFEIATRAADHVCRTFGAGANDGICGHPEIETSLVELFRLTGEQRYLDQATLFVDRRGRGQLADVALGRAYYQDDIPVRHARVLRGHAVRALYLAAGTVDVAVETGDNELLEAVVAQWDATVARRTYLTGGMGSRHAGESFGEDFALPPDRAYSETCAAIASVMLSWRLLLATGDPQYADMAERALFNVVATSPAADGRAFFYTNTLHQRTRAEAESAETVSPRPAASLRSSWFEVSCCPTNVARMLASLAGYVATADPHGLQIHQYADAEIHTELDDGRPIGVRMRTNYPDDGAITLEVIDAPPTAITISFRVPPWADRRATLTEPDGSSRSVPAGTAEVRRVFASGDIVRLELPVTPRWTVPDPRVDAVRGSVAVERGPLVLCVESVDLPDDADVDVVQVDTATAPVERDGAVIVSGELVEPPQASWPYGSQVSLDPKARQAVEIPLRPYHSWAERGPSTMRVWLPTTLRGLSP